MIKRLMVVIVLIAAGCGKPNPTSISGTYERELDGMQFKLVIDESGTFRDYFQYYWGDPGGATFTEQASGNCKLVDQEIHFQYETPANRKSMVVIYQLKPDGRLAAVAGIRDGERMDIPEEERTETLDWLKSSEPFVPPAKPKTGQAKAASDDPLSPGDMPYEPAPPPPREELLPPENGSARDQKSKLDPQAGK